MPDARDVDDVDEVSTLMQYRHDPTSAPESRFELTVVDGPDKGLRIVLDGSNPLPVLMGHGPSCDVKLSDRAVSRRHVALELQGRDLRMTDLRSKNGTFVGRTRIFDALLQGGEEITIGATSLRVARVGPAARVTLPSDPRFGKIFGASREMRRIYPLCERLAATNVPVIIEGETGTGKEVLAESIHEQSPRASGPFVVFDCTAVQPSLVESELFGHERGAFTGAVATRQGVFEQAHGGTLLIDEIGDLDLALQAKLLRAIERAEVRRVGGDRWIRVDVRILAATRRDLDHAVQVGQFRDDLFHRLAVARVALPPLRVRRGDIPALVRELWTQLGAGPDQVPPPELIARWETYDWPGNIRELRNAVARFLALGVAADDEENARGRSDERSASVERDVIEHVLSLGLPLIPARQRVVEHFERRYIARVLAEHQGNVVRAAAASGIARRHFHRLKSRHG